ncbi:MAG: hypothetical protein ACRENU_15610 [Gemmatimonadaceae bacterium]
MVTDEFVRRFAKVINRTILGLFLLIAAGIAVVFSVGQNTETPLAQTAAIITATAILINLILIASKVGVNLLLIRQKHRENKRAHREMIEAMLAPDPASSSPVRTAESREPTK